MSEKMVIFTTKIKVRPKILVTMQMIQTCTRSNKSWKFRGKDQIKLMMVEIMIMVGEVLMQEIREEYK